MKRYTLFSVGCLASATLLLESTLTRLLAIAQFYHFAFLVVSLALLGFGASGSLLSLSSRLRLTPLERLLPLSGVAFTLSVVLAYGVINWLPFDSYSIAWDRRQVLYFALYYLALTIPFICSGTAIGAALSGGEDSSHLVYASNLVGSALGALLAPWMISLAGVPGAVLASALIGILPMAGDIAFLRPAPRAVRWVPRLFLIFGAATLAVMTIANLENRSPLGMAISPYKGLSFARQYPGARQVLGRWDAISRLDILAEAGVRSLPGLSYTYPGSPPEQYGLALDADALRPITLAAPQDFTAAQFMPEAIAFQLKPLAEVLVLEPGAGLGVLQALSGGAKQVTAVNGDPFVPHAIAIAAPQANVFADRRVTNAWEPGRVFLRRDRSFYDIVFLPLTDAYRPVTSGAYSLSENYLLTVEAFQDALRRLEPEGIMVVTRWLQTPPSECIRLAATLVEALERQGYAHPEELIVAYRGIQTFTALVKLGGWSNGELSQIRSFLSQRRFDLVWAPDIQPGETNRYNRLPESVYYQTLEAMFSAPERGKFYAAYPFAVAPPSDDHPFFFHFFTWQQTPEILATLGMTWQPFGGSGYLILFALLALVLILSAALIAAPLLVRPKIAYRELTTPAVLASALAYFALLGIAFLFIEIPLIQRWILLLGHPIYAFTAVVAGLLFFSSIGSALSRSLWLPQRWALLVLFIMALLVPPMVSILTHLLLGFPLWARYAGAILSLAPVGILMGLPFPLGIARLQSKFPQLIPWAWAINGCASVISAILAAILALTYGFSIVFYLGAVAYGLAFAVFMVVRS